MDFRIRVGQWDNPQAPPLISSLRVETGQLVFVHPALAKRSSGAPLLLQVVASLVVGVVLFLLLYWLLHIIFVGFFLLPLFAWPLPGNSRSAAAIETAVPRSALVNVGGGGSTVAFGLDLASAPKQVAVLVEMVDEVEAERLRRELTS
jgi:hypothetical protein